MKCVDNAFQPYDNHHGNHSMVTCQTTCQETTTGTQTYYAGGKPQNNHGYGHGGATQVYGYNSGATHGYNGGATHGYKYNGGATPGYNGGTTQVPGCNSHAATGQVHGYGATQVHGYNGASGAAGMACYGKQQSNGVRRKHRKGGMDGNDSCSSGSDSDSDDECRRRC